MNLVEEIRFIYLRISITEPWRDIISCYKEISQILDGRDTSDTSSVDNNTDASAGDISGMWNDASISGANNNSDDKNAHAKTSFSFYNIADANTDADAGDITGTGGADSIGGADNNNNGKNDYAKASFNTYNIAGANADAGTGPDDTSGTDEKVSNNTNNIAKS